MLDTTTTAHTNIAFIKYWGKKDAALRLPYTDSLSLTLDNYYTATTTKIITGDVDQVFLNQKEAPLNFQQRTQKFLDAVRSKYQIDQHVQVQTDNHVPTAAGLASSASGFAALAGSLNKLWSLNLSDQELSSLARLGSGSAARSIFGGFVRWHHGSDHQSSYAEQIDDASRIPISLISVVFDSNAKKISSTVGMKRAVETSPYFPLWSQVVKTDLDKMLKAIKAADLEQIGQIAESNALAMHALNWTARPAFSYFTADTTELLGFIQNLRQQGLLAFATIDAGPNVKIITSDNDVNIVQNLIQQAFPTAQTTILHAGPGIE